MQGHSRIFLIGPRGSGKSTVARHLAGRLGWGWLDADAVLEERAGRSIKEIFDSQGEGAFRDLEEGVLRDLGRQERYVIATGGGVVLRPANRECLRAGGWVVWLTAPAETLHQRIRGDDSTAGRRPNLTVGGLEEVEQVLRARELLYRECAHLTVPTEGRPAEEVAAEIERVWCGGR